MVKKISELKDLQEDIKIDKTLDDLIISNKMDDFYSKIEELKTKNLFSDLRINCGDLESFSSKSQVQGLYDVYTDDSEKIC